MGVVSLCHTGAAHYPIKLLKVISPKQKLQDLVANHSLLRATTDRTASTTAAVVRSHTSCSAG